jgi:hypothetical protein
VSDTARFCGILEVLAAETKAHLRVRYVRICLDVDDHLEAAEVVAKDTVMAFGVFELGIFGGKVLFKVSAVLYLHRLNFSVLHLSANEQGVRHDV